MVSYSMFFLKKGVIMGDPNTDEVWENLDDVIEHKYSFANGVGLKISLTFVDEGGRSTQEVRAQCQKRLAKKIFCIKDFGGSDIPYTSPPKKQKIMLNRLRTGACWQYQLGVDAGKHIIMDNLRVQTPGAKYCHFPKRDDYGTEYFAGLLSERYLPGGKNGKFHWEKIPGHERNEPLDCRNYALAAFRVLSPNLDEIDRKLKAADGKSEEKTAKPPKNIKPRGSSGNAARSRIDEFYDSW